jgi:signal peptidase I
VISAIKRKLLKFDYRDFFSSLLWAILIAVVFRTFFFEPFRIPSGSMIPTLQIGDYLFTSKFSYGFSRYSFPFGIPLFQGRVFAKMPKRGDVIVFKGVKDTEHFYIKRLIGLPGDEVQVKRGVIYVNNEPIKRELKGALVKYEKSGGNKDFVEYMESIADGPTYSILQARDADLNMFPDETQVYKVPEGHFFFMGDNRDNSIDSRFIDIMGYVPFDRLVGRADYLLWTTDFSIIKFLESFDTARAFSFIQ